MKKLLLDRHFLVGTGYGLVLLFVALYGLLRADAWSLVVLSPLAFLAGYLVPLGVACLLDRPRVVAPGFFGSVGGLLVTYLSGVVAGSMANFLVHGQWETRPEFGWRNEIWHWFGKPAYALLLYGLPAALLVGVSFHFFTKIVVTGGSEKRGEQR